jgi:ABC-type transporter Mla MlaB component
MRAAGPDAGNDTLNVYLHDEAASFRFQIEGSLAGSAARQLEQSWRTALSVIGGRPLVINIGRLTRIDRSGRALLCKWRETGAQFIAGSSLTKILVGAMIGQPITSGQKRTNSERWAWFRTFALPLIPLLTLVSPGTIAAASLEPATLKAWEEYIDSANLRMEQRLSRDHEFLWVDEVPARLAKVRAGEIVVSPVGPQIPKRVPSGLIHDWVAAVYIPGVTLHDVFAVVSDYSSYKDIYKPTVVESKATGANGAKDRFSLVLMSKSFFLKTALDADYESCYVRIDDRRGYSVSQTTRIQEIEEYGAPAEHTLPRGQGHGIIWRLFGFTRYAERDGGVYIELEAIGLSRDIPSSLRWMAEPIIRRVSRGSLLTTLQQTENAVRLYVDLANGKARSGGSIGSTAGVSR